MNLTRTQQRPRTAPQSAAPPHVRHAPRPAPAAPRPVPATAQVPPRRHLLLPAAARTLMADLGLWHNPVPLKPSGHLEQTLAVLHRYGWCQSLDVSVTGRMCVRGAQNLLEKTGHVTPHDRQRAVALMQQTLHQAGVRMQFFTWNDLPDQQFSAVEALLTTTARTARANGE